MNRLWTNLAFLVALAVTVAAYLGLAALLWTLDGVRWLRQQQRNISCSNQADLIR